MRRDDYPVVSTVADKLRVGQRVETNGNGDGIVTNEWFKGIITNINSLKFTVKREDGQPGGGWNADWQIRLNNDEAQIRIYKQSTKNPHCCVICGKQGVHKVDNNYLCPTCFKRRVGNCTHCQKPTYLKLNKKFVCPTCRAEHYTPCRHCALSTLISKVVDGLCPTCYERYFKKCQACGKVHHMYHYIEHPETGKKFCFDCFRTLYTNCGHCGKTRDRLGNEPVRTYDGSEICAACAKKHYVDCVTCGKKTYRDTDILKMFGKDYCPFCVENQKASVSKRTALPMEVQQITKVLLGRGKRL
jgi:hypothetical protein